MQTFLALTKEDLKEMGVEPFAVRKRLLMAIQGDPVECSFRRRCVLEPNSLFLSEHNLTAETGVGHAVSVGRGPVMRGR